MNHPIKENYRDEESTKYLPRFLDATLAITNSVKLFRQVVSEDVEQPDYISSNEDSPYSAKLPVGAYCLRVAYQLWQDIFFERHGHRHTHGIVMEDISEEEKNIVSLLSKLDPERRDLILSFFAEMQEEDD